MVISEEELVGRKVWDATGLIVSPGFIDIHSHVSGQDYAGLYPHAGDNTTVGGNCGGSPVDLGKFF